MANRSRFSYPILLASTVVLLSACSSDSDDKTNNVEVNFSAKVGTEAFECGKIYSDIGVGIGDASNYQVNDFRVFVSDLKLTKTDGSKVDLVLTQDGIWQHEGTALLDFENGCSGNGNAETNTVVKATVDDDQYTGICMTVGVPFSQNHEDTASAPSPLNASGMFWNWQGGHKFIRIDGVGDPGDTTHANKGYNLHLGSTGCAAPGKTSSPEEQCTYPNVMEVCFGGDGTTTFDTTNNSVVFDIKSVFAESNVTIDDEAPAGCMSFPGDSACNEILPRLGLPYAYNSEQISPALEQQFVGIE